MDRLARTDCRMEADWLLQLAILHHPMHPFQNFLWTCQISGFFQRQHFSAVMPVIISAAGFRTNVELCQKLLILRIDLPMLPIRQIQIHIFAVDCSNTGNIFRALHPPFYFKGIDFCIHQLR